MTAVDEGTGNRAVIDLLGVLAYAELTAFDRLAEDARLAPTLEGRAALARMAAAEIEHHERLAERLQELGVDVSAAMRASAARPTRVGASRASSASRSKAVSSA